MSFSDIFSMFIKLNELVIRSKTGDSNHLVNAVCPSHLPAWFWSVRLSTAWIFLLHHRRSTCLKVGLIPTAHSSRSPQCNRRITANEVANSATNTLNLLWRLQNRSPPLFSYLRAFILKQHCREHCIFTREKKEEKLKIFPAQTRASSVERPTWMFCPRTSIFIYFFPTLNHSHNFSVTPSPLMIRFGLIKMFINHQEKI